MSVEQLPVVAMSRLDDTTWSGTYDGTIVEGDYLATVNGTDGAGNFVMGTAVSFMSDQVVVHHRITTPTGMFLAPVSPNPVRGGAVVRFGLPSAMDASLTVYDSKGRSVRRLFSRHLSSGHHQVMWDGMGERGERLSPGYYFIRFSTGMQTLSTELLKVR
jgi:hypothetical protein